MIHYETLILARTEITDDELNTIEKQFDSLASNAKGSLVSFEKWGKYRLSYPVQKHDYGVYVLARYDVPVQGAQEMIKEIDFFFKIKCGDAVMRHCSVKLDQKAPLEYKRPEPADAGGRSSIDAFLKKNNMKGMVDTTVSEPAAASQDEFAGDDADDFSDSSEEVVAPSTDSSSEESGEA